MTMDGYQLSSSVISSLAWPISVFAISLLFRQQIGQQLARLKEVSVGGTKISFAEKLDALEEASPLIVAAAGTTEATSQAVGNIVPKDHQESAIPSSALSDASFQGFLALSPSAAILESWRPIETRLREIADVPNISPEIDRPHPISIVIFTLRNRNQIDDRQRDVLIGLWELRNQAARQDVTSADAIRFKMLADGMFRDLGGA